MNGWSSLPQSRVPDPRDAPPLRWGILGTGWIAERLVAAAQKLTVQPVAAVGSRSQESADQFAQRFGIPAAHGSYDALVADPDVDVVYVATPHNAHLEHAELAMKAGKHVLVEKPLTVNAGQARQLATLASERGLFCSEALWSLFLPKFDVIRQLLDAELLGPVRTVISDYGEHFTPDHRIFRADLAGGPMLDLGTYPFSLAHWVLGVPNRVSAIGDRAPTGVNGQAAAALGFADGAEASLHISLFSNTPVSATIAGEAGTLTIPSNFTRPGPFWVVSADLGARLDYSEPETAYDGLAFEVAEVARRIAAGELGSPVRPLTDSIATLEIMDEVRRQIGATFSGEDEAP
jgi:predicted dehydrogenase